MGVAIFVFEKLLLEESIQGKACRCALGYAQVYWQDISQLLESYTLRFDARREKVRLTGVARATAITFSSLVCLYCEL